MKLAAVVVSLAAVLALSACGSGADVGAATVTTVNSPTARATLSEAQAKAVVNSHVKEFKQTARAFRKCDRKVESDSYVESPCLDKALAELAVVDDLLGDLTSVALPATYMTTIADLRKMSAAGAAVAAKCAKANDQTCDKALARFRADEQSVLWDLDISL